jgi:hypothetical protein
MKTAVSIPDDVFAETERLAKKMKKPRSELYSLALAEYVARHAPEHVTEAMNRVCDAVGGKVDKFTTVASRQILERVEWWFCRAISGGPICLSRSVPPSGFAGLL